MRNAHSKRIISTNSTAQSDTDAGSHTYKYCSNHSSQKRHFIQLRPQRFNQDLSPGALLIEVGAAGNTHTEALTAAQALAEAIVDLAAGTETVQ